MWHWMGGGTSNASLVEHLIKTGRVSSPRVADAMRAVDRGKFVAAFPGADVAHAYMVREEEGGGRASSFFGLRIAWVWALASARHAGAAPASPTAPDGYARRLQAGYARNRPGFDRRRKRGMWRGDDFFFARRPAFDHFRSSPLPLPPARPLSSQDTPLSIGHGQTISGPHIHAAVLDVLEDVLRPGASVLDVGSGSGILLPLFWSLVRPGGRVVGVDKHAPLVDASRAPVAAAAPDGVASGAVQLRVANVLAPGALGDDARNAFDAIHVGAAAAEVPACLVDALKPGGKLILPVGPDGGEQVLQLVTKGEDGRVSVDSLMGVRYVPLTPPGKDKYGGL